MKKIFIYIALATLAMSVASCQKESLNEDVNSSSDSLVFAASIDGGMDTKTILTSEKKVNWEATDEITVNGVAYTATPKSDATKADFTKKNSGDADPTGTFNAFYPSGIQTGNSAGGILPAEQTYAAGKITNVPMFATSETTSLSFKNICAVLAVTVKSADFPSVKSIKVSSSNCALSGAFTVSDGNTAVLTDASTVANAVVLNCGTAVTTASEGTVFYIAIPAQTYKNLKIELSADGSSYAKFMTTKKDADIAVAVNTVYPLTFKADVLLSGVFTISAGKDGFKNTSDDIKVQFTRGNLYFDGSAWRLEEKQTDYPTTWSTSHVGHFFWSKTASLTYGEAYGDSSAAVEDALFCAEATPLTIGGTSGLFALSADEWTYLLNVDQEASYRTDHNRFAHARVNGVCGLVIFPDGYNSDEAISGVTGIAAINTADAAYPSESVTDWSSMESAGCVFLPDAGCRNGTTFGNLGNAGSYWTATSPTSNADKAYCMVFTGQNAVSGGSSGQVRPSSNGARQLGASIRLVRTVK